jgi:hypothetical protein
MHLNINIQFIESIKIVCNNLKIDHILQSESCVHTNYQILSCN